MKHVKEYLEIETLKALTYTQINEVLNKLTLENKELKEQLRLHVVSERYTKEDVIQFEDGWYITFKAINGRIIKLHGSYRTKAMAEHDRRTLNAR